MKSAKTRTAPLHVGGRMDDGNAFLRDPGSGPARTKDALAESLAEQFLTSATSAEESTADDNDRDVPEDSGGPFIETTGKKEFARDSEAPNIPEAERAPFPSPMRGGKRHS
jgi:hypothetical protein